MNNKPWNDDREALNSSGLSRKQSSKLKPSYLRKKAFSLFAKTYLVMSWIQDWMSLKNCLQEINEMSNWWLREGSIIWNPLYFPDSHDNSFRFQNAAAWLWNSYDFKRDTFSEDSILYFFPIEDDEVNMESGIEELTPDGYFQFFQLEHFMYNSKLSIEQALEYWAIRDTTYEEALYRSDNEQLLEEAKKFNILTKEVLQVTPKGNGLIHPSGNGGNKKSSKKDTNTESVRDTDIIPQGL